MDASRFAKHLINYVDQVKIAAIHPDFSEAYCFYP